MRKLLTVHTVDILERDLSGGPARFPEPAPLPGVSVRVFEDLDDPALREALPADRLPLLRERGRRGDVYVMVFVEGAPAGWLTLARRSHRDPWSGLRVRLADGETYCYDLWVHAPYRRAGAARHLAGWILHYLARDPTVERVYCWVEEDNVPSQTLLRQGFGLTEVQKIRYARLLDRVGVRVPFSDRPRYGPFSRRGRHRR